LPASKSLSGMIRVLVVEDNVPQAESLGMILQTYGHRPLLAGDDKQAKAQLETHGADAVILDLVISNREGMSGRELLKWLKSEESTKHLPVVVSTGLPEEKVEDLKALPKVKVLIKPYTVEALYGAFREMGLDLDRDVSSPTKG